MTDITVRKQNKSWQFQPGQSGNPKGRPKGCRHRATVAAEALLDGEAEGLTRKAIELALAGDTMALRLCIERILPARKDRPVQLHIPEIEGVQDLTKATTALLRAVAAGELTLTEAAEVAKLVEAHRRTVETVELEQRLQRIEEAQGWHG
jgi:UDP-N-acetyl-D-mannosaminuronate dehydrogenase